MILLDIGYIILLLLTLPFWLRFLIQKKYRRLMGNRFTPGIQSREKECLWIHAVSVGEVKSLVHLIDRLLEGGYPIVLSVTTPSGYEYARKTLHRIPVINAPLDFSFVIKRFIKALNPRLLILNELEIWPNWISIMKKNRIPVVVINGRMSEAAFRRYSWCRRLFSRYLNRIDLFFLQSRLHRERFLALGLPDSKIRICGNIKADEAFQLKKNLPSTGEIMNAMKLDPFRKKVVVLASTHPADEKVALPALKALADRYAFIIAPRHPERARQTAGQLEKLGLAAALWSRARRIRLDETILVIDRIGHLFQIMAIADLVFMGGTFQRKTGGHNLYEPAIHGKPVVGGPCFNNFPVIGAELVERGIYRVVNNSREIEECLAEMENQDLSQRGREALDTVLDKRGSVECILKGLQPVIGH